jgi:predicted GNAT superfamily acetyltransferase
MAEITSIRTLHTLDEMQQVVALQRTYWGDDVESVVPAHMLFSLATHGGHVLAAFDEDTIVGVLIGFLGTDPEEAHRIAMANLQIVSKRMVVLPAYRGQGVGYKLKKRQREFAMRQGVRLITWTFDPLLAANAHLNIHKLGAIAPRYLEDYYGTANQGGLSRLGSSDRLLVEWWITNRRVEVRLSGSRGDLTLDQYMDANTPIKNPASVRVDGMPVPASSAQWVEGSLVLVEIPTDYDGLAQQDTALAVQWRNHTREMFQQMFSYGYVVTDFVRGQLEGRERSFYLLSQADAVFERIDYRAN